MLPKQVAEWIQQQGFSDQISIKPISGGCINNGMRLETAGGEKFFLKVNMDAPEDMFDREAEGLVALNVVDGPRIPSPYIFGSGFILMEDLEPAQRSTSYWSDFGHQMAALHQHTSKRFGFKHDNYIGSTPQPNEWTDDGYVFYAEQRLIYQAELAFKKGLLHLRDGDAVKRLTDRLRDLIPQQPASLIHGDLWSGNAISDRNGNPAIIDPAVHYGWAEADLAMTSLFGSFPDEFYLAYQEVRPLEASFRDRFPLYNLYHLINHLNLFGSSYLGQVKSILGRYS